MQELYDNLSKALRCEDKISFIVVLIDTATLLETLGAYKEGIEWIKDSAPGNPERRLISLALEDLEEAMDEEEIRAVLSDVYRSVLTCLASFSIYHKDIRAFRPNQVFSQD